MLFNLIAFALLGLAQADLLTTCKDFKSVPINYNDLVMAGPLKLTWTNNPTLTCTTGLLTPSANQKYYFMLLQGKQVTYSFAIDGTMAPTDAGITLTACNSTTSYTYKFIQADLTGTNPVFIAFICDENGKITLIKSYSQNPADPTTADALKKKITDTFDASVYGKLVNGWDSANMCPDYSTCGGFF